MHTLCPEDFQLLLQRPGVLLLDVRMPEEVALATLPGALNIPLHELPARHAEIGHPASIAIYCHHGVRSEHAARLLQRLGHPEVSHLAGGIDAWSLRIDPQTPRY